MCPDISISKPGAAIHNAHTYVLLCLVCGIIVKQGIIHAVVVCGPDLCIGALFMDPCQVMEHLMATLYLGMQVQSCVSHS